MHLMGVISYFTSSIYCAPWNRGAKFTQEKCKSGQGRMLEGETLKMTIRSQTHLQYKGN